MSELLHYLLIHLAMPLHRTLHRGMLVMSQITVCSVLIGDIMVSDLEPSTVWAVGLYWILTF